VIPARIPPAPPAEAPTGTGPAWTAWAEAVAGGVVPTSAAPDHEVGEELDLDDELPAEAYAAALAGLPGMGPARLAAVLNASPPAAAWARVRQGTPWREPVILSALGRNGQQLLSDWRAAAARTDPAMVWRRLVEARVGVALWRAPSYPAVLVDDIDPPAIVFHRGRPDVLARGPRVAIVGTRRCTPTGKAVAFELGRDLAIEGVSVVSGLAWGIDGAAHRGAVAGDDAPPVGVVGNGLDIVYPAGQHELWAAVAEAGVLLSEAPLGTRPERWRFPARNRIIAALSDLVVVVESHRTGGSMHTVDQADLRGVDVMAVPGSVHNVAAAGTNALLAEGRLPVRDAGDVLVALGLSQSRQVACAEHRAPPAPDDQPVLEAVGWQPSSLDQLARRSGLALPALAAAIERLRAGGWLSQRGGWYERIAQGQDGRSLP
jgi:DNA processing protein